MTDETTHPTGATTDQTPVRTDWFSPRALRLHAVLLVVVPAFTAMCVWQITRALGGNELSWAYVFEWPIFAAYAVYMWWRLVHERVGESSSPVTAGGPPGSTGQAAPTRNAPAGIVSGEGLALPAEPSVRPHDEGDAELAAYNAYLAELAERDRASGR